MATENIKIKIQVDKSELDGAVSSTKVLESELKKAGVSAEFMDDALAEVDKTLKDAGVEAKVFNKALSESATSTKSLKTQLAEAKNEAVKMSQQFGAFSKEAREAAKRAAVIKDEIGDLNDTLDALNPEAKLNAFVKLGQGIQGGFQAATGALQLFGVENERITKIAQQFQGVLNITQGINSVLQLKDVYGQLRIVLGVTSAAQTGLNTATVAGTTATRGLTAALAANPFTAAAIALIALATAVYGYSKATEESTENLAENNAELEKQIENQRALAEAYQKSATQTAVAIQDQRIRLALALGQIDELTAKLQQLELNRQRAVTEFVRQFGNDLIGIAEINKKFGIEEQIIRAEDAAEKAKKKIAEIPRELVKEFVGTKTDLTKEIKSLVDKVNEELEKIKPISVGPRESGDRALFDSINAQVEEINKSILQQSLTVFDNLLDAQSQARIEKLEEEKKQGLITEEKYQAEVGKIKRKQALQDRAFAIFNVYLSTAEAIMKAAAQLGTFAAPVIAAYTALGAAQTAAILSAPLPKFKAGTLNVGGGNLDADGGMAAIIHKGEAVIPQDQNRMYHPTIEAIFNRKVRASDINSFVQMKLSGQLSNKVNASLSAKDLRGLKSPDSVAIKNTNILAKQIGREIASNINLRRQ